MGNPQITLEQHYATRAGEILRLHEGFGDEIGAIDSNQTNSIVDRVDEERYAFGSFTAPSLKIILMRSRLTGLTLVTTIIHACESNA